LEYGGALFKLVSPDEILSHTRLSTPEMYILDNAIEYENELIEFISKASSKNILIVDRDYNTTPEWVDWILKQPLSYPEILEMSYKILKRKRINDIVEEKKKNLSLQDMKILLAEDNPVNRKWQGLY